MEVFLTQKIGDMLSETRILPIEHWWLEDEFWVQTYFQGQTVNFGEMWKGMHLWRFSSNEVVFLLKRDH